MRANPLTICRTSAIASTIFLALLLIAACAPQGGKEPAPVASDHDANAELKWARAALERNPELKVEAVDEAKQSIRVRVKATGEIVTVSPGELAAIPIADLVALTSASRVAQTEPPPPHVVEEPASPEPAPTPAPSQERKSDYKVERQDGRVHITGPGVNIESTESTSSTSPPTRKFNEPIICEGRRTLFLDRRSITVSGDAIIARSGCELHLTNSQVSATGVGIIIQDATVHVANSTIQGGEASIDAAATASLYLQNAQFVGISRRDPQAKIVDQGGNSWR